MTRMMVIIGEPMYYVACSDDPFQIYGRFIGPVQRY